MKVLQDLRNNFGIKEICVIFENTEHNSESVGMLLSCQI